MRLHAATAARAGRSVADCPHDVPRISVVALVDRLGAVDRLARVGAVHRQRRLGGLARQHRLGRFDVLCRVGDERGLGAVLPVALVPDVVPVVRRGDEFEISRRAAFEVVVDKGLLVGGSVGGRF
jgi:hypothetical protein